MVVKANFNRLSGCINFFFCKCIIDENDINRWGFPAFFALHYFWNNLFSLCG